MKSYVIAEIATTWEMDRSRMLALMYAVKDAGCKAVKTQWTSDPARMALRRRMPNDAYNYLKWPAEWHPQFADEARRLNMDYLCTVYLSEDLSAIAPYVARFKIASLEAGDGVLRRAHAAYKQPVLISTGVMEHEEVLALRRECLADGLMDATLLLTSSCYPCGHEEVNLNAIRSGCYGGFSDHTHDLTMGGAAVVAMGRPGVIEVHVRDASTRVDNPDFLHSLLPQELTQYVREIQLKERALGSATRVVTDGEKPLRFHRVVRP